MPGEGGIDHRMPEFGGDNDCGKFGEEQLVQILGRVTVVWNSRE